MQSQCRRVPLGHRSKLWQTASYYVQGFFACSCQLGMMAASRITTGDQLRTQVTHRHGRAKTTFKAAMCWEPCAATSDPSRVFSAQSWIIRSEDLKEVTMWQGAATLTAGQGISQPNKVRLFQIYANSEGNLVTWIIKLQPVGLDRTEQRNEQKVTANFPCVCAEF